MIYSPKISQKLTKEEEEIYRRIIEKHKSYIRSKYNFLDRAGSEKCQTRQRAKSRFYEENKEKQFMNTFFNRPHEDGSKLSLDELKQIPAEEFLELCSKLEKMRISRKSCRKEQNEDKISENNIEESNKKNSLLSSKSLLKSMSQRKNRLKRSSIKESKLLSTSQNHSFQDKYSDLQKNVKKMFPKLPKSGVISNGFFFQLFTRKMDEVRRLNYLKQQAELQVQYQNCQKIEAMIDARKTAKQYQISKQLCEYFKEKITSTTKNGHQLLVEIKQGLQKLQVQVQNKTNEVTTQQKAEIFSANCLRIKSNQNRILVFQEISNRILDFNERVDSYYESELTTKLSIIQLKSLIEYFTVCIKDLSTSINKQLSLLFQEFYSANEAVQIIKFNFILPQQATKIENGYALNDIRIFHEDFMICRQFVFLLYQHLKKILEIKDLLTQSERKCPQSSMSKSKREKIIRIT